MAQLAPRHWHSILDVMGSANAYVEEFTVFRQQVLRALQKAIRADNANFFLVDDQLRPIDAVGLNLAEKYLQLYQSHFFKLNPFDPCQAIVPVRHVLVDTELYKFADYKRTRYFNEFIKPQDVRRQMVLYLTSKEKLLGFIGLHRAEEKAAFKGWELAIAETVAPLLSQSLEKAQAFNRVRAKELFLQAIIDRSHSGAIIVNCLMEPLYVNEAAGQLFNRLGADGTALQKLRNSEHAVPAQVHHQAVEFIARTRHRPHTSPALRACFSMTLSARQTLTVGLETLCVHDPAGAAPLILITVEEESSAPEPINETRLAREYGFTKRELEIVHLIFKGLKNSEIAMLLFISEGTVKNHLKNIYNKIGVTTRTSLIHDILNH